MPDASGNGSEAGLVSMASFPELKLKSVLNPNAGAASREGSAEEGLAAGPLTTIEAAVADCKSTWPAAARAIPSGAIAEFRTPATSAALAAETLAKSAARIDTVTGDREPTVMVNCMPWRNGKGSVTDRKSNRL